MAGRPGLTLEQLLARTLQLPRNRAAQALNAAAPKAKPPAHAPPLPPPPPGAPGAPPPPPPPPAAATVAPKPLGLSRLMAEAPTGNRLFLRSTKVPSAAYMEPSPQPLSSTVADFATTLRTAGALGDWAAALAAFARVTKDALIPPAPLLGQLVALCARHGEFDAAMAALDGARKGWQERAHHRKVIREHTAADDADAPRPRHVQPEEIESVDVVILEHLARSELWEAALAMFERLPTRNTATYNAVVCACERGGQWEKGLALLAEMDAKVAAGDAACAPNAITFAALMAALEQAGQADAAKALLGRMPRKASQEVMSSYAELINVWGRKHGKRALRRF